eukprot:4359475-Pleurochrysis_carterae.AAC.2
MPSRPDAANGRARRVRPARCHIGRESGERHTQYRANNEVARRTRRLGHIRSRQAGATRACGVQLAVGRHRAIGLVQIVEREDVRELEERLDQRVRAAAERLADTAHQVDADGAGGLLSVGLAPLPLGVPPPRATRLVANVAARAPRVLEHLVIPRLRVPVVLRVWWRRRQRRAVRRRRRRRR